MNRGDAGHHGGCDACGTLHAEADEGRSSNEPGLRLPRLRAVWAATLSRVRQIGGIEKSVRGKTVAFKLNLTGNGKNWPLTPELAYRTDPQSVATTVHLFAQTGARRVGMMESFFPADQDLSPWTRYGLDVNAINNMSVPVV